MPLAFVAAMLGRFGLSRDLSARLAPFILLAVLVLLILLGWGLWLRSHDHAVLAAHDAQIARQEAPARDQAAAARAADAISNAHEQEDYHAAIDSAHASGAPDAADHALACQRLRRAGVALPAGC